MSRIGKQIHILPEGVDLKISEGFIVVKGPKGELQQKLHEKVSVNIDDKNISVTVQDEKLKDDRALWGLFGSLIQNMIEGVSKGFEKKLEINGIGYKAAVSGKVLILNLGFSHDIKYNVPEGIEIVVEKNIVTISGIDKQMVGQVAAEIRSYRKPEPYLGKGIKYIDEVIIRKQGKAASKAAA